MSTPPDRRRGLTLLEVLVAALLLGLILPPLMGVLTSANRSAYSADRLFLATQWAEGLLEGLAGLSIEELPALTEEEETVLYAGGPELLWGGSGRYLSDLPARLAARPDFVVSVEVKAFLLAGGQVRFELHLEFEGLPDDPASRRPLMLASVSSHPRWG